MKLIRRGGFEGLFLERRSIGLEDAILLPLLLVLLFSRSESISLFSIFQFQSL